MDEGEKLACSSAVVIFTRHQYWSGIIDLPGYVLNDVCGVLDSSAQHNWKKLLEHLPDYTHKDVMELCNLAQQVSTRLKLYLLWEWVPSEPRQGRIYTPYSVTKNLISTQWSFKLEEQISFNYIEWQKVEPV